MNKTVAAIVAVASLGAGIASAQAALGYNPYEDVNVQNRMESMPPVTDNERFLVERGVTPVAPTTLAALAETSFGPMAPAAARDLVNSPTGAPGPGGPSIVRPLEAL